MSRRAPYAWRAPRPAVEKAHDVRRLAVCCFCEVLGDSLLYVDRTEGELPRLLRKRGRTAHAYCLVKKEGIVALARLHVDEIDKVTLNDILGLGVRLDDVTVMSNAAMKRQRNEGAE